ncbi:MAG: MarR family transcriptional regulator [Candidatus Methylomirabilota bacterium]
MSARDVANAAHRLQESTLGVLWRQWGALGATTASDPARSLIDPEALVLASLVFQGAERRLSDVLRWWARSGAPLLSVTRTRSLARQFPDAIRNLLGEFAAMAVREGRDFRWRPLAHPSSTPAGRHTKVLGAAPRLLAPPALLLRLRLGFGVTVKADLLTALLGSAEGWLSVRQIAASLGYTAQSVRRAADDLAAARLIQVTRETPTGYRVDQKSWAGLLGASAKHLPWRHLPPVFAFVAALSEWTRKEARSAAPSDYVLSTRARDIVGAHQSAFVQNRLTIPRPEDSPGETYLAAFRETLAVLEKWLDESG